MPRKQLTQRAPVGPAILRAWRRNQGADSNAPDLTITPDPANLWFKFGGKDIEGSDISSALQQIYRNKSTDKKWHIPWPYTRLEIFADGQTLTLVVPTLHGVNVDHEFLGVSQNGANPRSLSLYCHVLILNGAVNDGGGTNATTIRIELDLYLDPKTKQVKFFWTGHLGHTHWDVEQEVQVNEDDPANRKFDRLFSELPILLKQQYTQDLATPGPLLGGYFAANGDKFNDQDQLIIGVRQGMVTYGTSTRLIPALAFVFRPHNGAPGFPLDLRRSAGPFDKLNLVAGKYRVVQRASDDWLACRADEEWLVAVESTGLANIWNTAQQKYLDALGTVRPNNALTFVPALSSVNAPPDDYDICSYTIVRRGKGAIEQVALAGELKYGTATIGPSAGTTGTLTFGLTDGAFLVYINTSLSPLWALNQQNYWLGIRLDSLGNEQQSPQVRVGSMDLVFGGASSQPQTLELKTFATKLETRPRFHLSLNLPVFSIEPSGEDSVATSVFTPANYVASDVPAEECMEQRYTGTAPIIARLGTQDSLPGPFLLRIVEDNSGDYSQTVSLELDLVEGQSRPGMQSTQRIVVIDTDPFLVAEVQYDPLGMNGGSGPLAIWNTAQNAWQFQTGNSAFKLTLPPQVVGEEMPKALELNAKDGRDDSNATGTIVPSALDFRFSPTATQQLKTSLQEQNYTEAPWNLRRILGYPGQADDPGASVVQLTYELLYGIACTADPDASLMRFAELFAMVGRIPGRLLPFSNRQQQTSVTNLDGATHKKIEDVYNNHRTLWSYYAGIYNNRTAILEPRRPSDARANSGTVSATPPEVFTLDNGVSCLQRDKADLYYSVDPKLLSLTPQDQFPVSPSGLRGGFTWPFEAPRLFRAMVNNPKSSSAKISGLAYSMFGGTGVQKIDFDLGRSTVFSVTEIGRTSKVSVSRLGRIGVYHNLARYVIEYERTVAVSEQFKQPDPKSPPQQTPFYGRPVLRKVREYVEVLEPTVTLPPATAQSPNGGFIKSIEFKQTIIPVLNAWASNVGTDGWKIPLWDEATSLSNSFYARPPIVFNVAGADGADSQCAIESVDQLCFYTNVDATASADPRQWRVVPGVDFSLAPVPQPNPAFPSNSIHELPAYDPPTPFGLKAFTLQVTGGNTTTNIVSGRSKQAIGATVRSVTVQRRPPVSSTPPSGGPQTPAQIAQSLHDAIRSDAYSSIRQGQPVTGATAAALKSGFTSLTKQIPSFGLSAYTPAVPIPLGLLQSVLAQEKQLLQKLQAQIQQAITSTFNDEMTGQLVVFLQWKVDDAARDVKAQMKKAAHNEIDALFKRLENLPATANVMAQFAYRCQTALQTAQNDINNLRAAVVASRDAIGNVLGAPGTIVASQVNSTCDAIQAASNQLTAKLSAIDARLAQVRRQIASKVESWMPYASVVCLVWENQIAGATTLLSNITIAASSAIATLGQQVETSIDNTLQPVRDAITAANNTALKAIDLTNVWPLPDMAAAADVVGAYLESIKAKFAADQTQANAIIDKAIDDGIGKATTITNTELANIVSNLASQLSSQIQAASISIDADINTILAGLSKFVTGLITDIGGLVDSMTRTVGAQAEALRRQIEDTLSRYVEGMMDSLLPVDVNFPAGTEVAAALHRAFGTAPAISNLDFSLPNVGYFFPSLGQNISLTPLLTSIKGLGDALSPLSTMVPSFQLLDHAIPVPSLSNFDLSNVFPNFAGLQLSNLFPSLKLPSGCDQNVKITHGLDAQSRKAWVQADIQLHTAPATIFSIGPMMLQIDKPFFSATVKASADGTGRVSRTASGFIRGDWNLIIGGSPMITLAQSSLSFDENGKLHVDISPDRVVLAEALRFVQDIISQYVSPDSGFSLLPSATGIETRFSMPIPDTVAGTSGITGLSFNFLFGLNWLPKFELYAGFGLSSPEDPFNLSVFILGGGGHLVATARYQPGGRLTCNVDMGMDASASLGIAFGPINGNVHVNLGMRFLFNSGEGDLSLGVFLIIAGEVSILSIVSANITLRLEATYANGHFTCRGTFSISIKICWCFTLSVHEEVSCGIGSGGGIGWNQPPSLPWLPDGSEAPAEIYTLGQTLPTQTQLDQYPINIKRYIHLIS